MFIAIGLICLNTGFALFRPNEITTNQIIATGFFCMFLLLWKGMTIINDSIKRIYDNKELLNG